jgi:hypothetical protein
MHEDNGYFFWIVTEFPLCHSERSVESSKGEKTKCRVVMYVEEDSSFLRMTKTIASFLSRDIFVLIRYSRRSLPLGLVLLS